MPNSLAVAAFWVAVACCAVAQWFILRVALARPATPRAGNVVPDSPRVAEVAWAVLPAILLAVVLAATWRAMHSGSSPNTRPAPAHTAALGVEVFRA